MFILSSIKGGHGSEVTNRTRRFQVPPEPNMRVTSSSSGSPQAPTPHPGSLQARPGPSSRNRGTPPVPSGHPQPAPPAGVRKLSFQAQIQRRVLPQHSRAFLRAEEVVRLLDDAQLFGQRRPAVLDAVIPRKPGAPKSRTRSARGRSRSTPLCTCVSTIIRHLLSVLCTSPHSRLRIPHIQISPDRLFDRLGLPLQFGNCPRVQIQR